MHFHGIHLFVTFIKQSSKSCTWIILIQLHEYLTALLYVQEQGKWLITYTSKYKVGKPTKIYRPQALTLLLLLLLLF